MSILNKLIFAFMLLAYLPIINAAVIITHDNSDLTYEYGLDGLLESPKLSGDSLMFAPLISSELSENSIDRDLNIGIFIAKVDLLPAHRRGSISMDENKDDLFEGTKTGLFDKEDLKEAEFSGQASVPLPQAVWMFGVGLLGLLSAAKRKKIM